MPASDLDEAAEQPTSRTTTRDGGEALRELSRRLAVIAGELRRVSEGAAGGELRRETAAAIGEVCRASAALEATLAGKGFAAGADIGAAMGAASGGASGASAALAVPFGDAPPPSQHRASAKPSARITFDDIIGEDPAFRACLDLARRAALSDLPIVVSGETGTGKEMLAQAIHNASARARSPFVGINVAAIPRELVESELFGYAQGAFTGARAGGKSGLFELAEDGTLLLDEVGDMPFDLQVKLLRVLQEKSVMRVGGAREIPFRARVITTTHRDLQRAVEMGTFRADLYYRLRGIHLRIPALRERRGDIDLLIDACLSRFAARHGRPKAQILPRVLAAYKAGEWPGNVRELVHLVEAEASLLRPGETHILRMPTSLQRAFQPVATGRPPPPLESSRPPPFPAEAPTHPEGRPAMDGPAEQRVIEETLAQFDGNISKAARALGVARGTLYNRMRRFGLQDWEAPESSPPRSLKR